MLLPLPLRMMLEYLLPTNEIRELRVRDSAALEFGTERQQSNLRFE